MTSQEIPNWTVSRCKTVVWLRNILITMGKKIDVKTFGAFCASYGASFVTLIKADGNSELIKYFIRVYFAAVCTLIICSLLVKPSSTSEHAESMLRDMGDLSDLLSGASILLQIGGIYWAIFSPMDTPYCCCMVSICICLVLCAAAHYYKITSRVTALDVMHKKEQSLITYQRRKAKQTDLREASSQCHTGHTYHELSPIPHRPTPNLERANQHVLSNGITSSGSRATALDVMQQKEQPLITYQRRNAKQTGVDNVSNLQCCSACYAKKHYSN